MKNKAKLVYDFSCCVKSGQHSHSQHRIDTNATDYTGLNIKCAVRIQMASGINIKCAGRKKERKVKYKRGHLIFTPINCNKTDTKEPYSHTVTLCFSM